MAFSQQVNIVQDIALSSMKGQLQSLWNALFLVTVAFMQMSCCQLTNELSG